MGELLSRSEETARQTEKNYKAASAQRLPNQWDFVDAHARLGRVLHHSDFIAPLRKAIPTLHVCDGQPGYISLYVPTANGNQLRYLGWVGEGDNAEYSSFVLGKYDVPKLERRGWRTTLLRILLAGAISERQALRIFGQPSNGIVSKYWRLGLWNARHATN